MLKMMLKFGYKMKTQDVGNFDRERREREKRRRGGGCRFKAIFLTDFPPETPLFTHALSFTFFKA